MTREEEMKIAILKEHQRNQAIEEAAHQNTLEKCQGHYYKDWFYGFMNGAQWADEHPKDNPVDIDEVCEWLKHHVYDYFYWIEMEGESEANIKQELFTDLKQAMKRE